MSKNINSYEYGNIFTVAIIHALVLFALPVYFYYRGVTLALFIGLFIFYMLGGLGITLLYHRYYSHKSFKMKKWTEGVFLLFVTLGLMGSSISWTHDHRNHHAFEDGPRDPYSIKHGFMHAHLFWMFKKREFDAKLVSDLLKNKLVMMHHKYYTHLVFILNGAILVAFGLLTGDYLGAFLIPIVLRIFLIHHCTWFINSLAHTFGSKSHKDSTTAVDNFLIALFTFGEGYHNYHHTYPLDYRNGIRWFHYDPAKWVIFMLSKVGLTWDLKRAGVSSE